MTTTLNNDAVVTLDGYDLVATVRGQGIVNGRMICRRSAMTAWPVPAGHHPSSSAVEKGCVIVDVFCGSQKEVREIELRQLTVDDVKKYYGNDLKAKLAAISQLIAVN